MAEPKNPTPNPANPAPTAPKRGLCGTWRRKLLFLAGLLVVLLIVAYFVGTSAGFLKSFILPRVSQAVGVDVTVADAQISPFSHVGLQDLKVQPRNGEPLLTAKEIHANYSLWSILGGTLAVSEAVIESPVVTVVQNADGTSSLDVFTKSATTKPSSTAAPSTSSKPLRVDIRKVALNNATVRWVNKLAGGGQDVVEITGLNFTLNNLKNGEAGKMAVTAALAAQQAARPNAPAGTLAAKLDGAFDFALTPAAKPASAQGNLTLAVSQAAGSLADFATAAVKVEASLTPTELKALAISLAKGDAKLADIRLSGPFDTAKSEGKLQLTVSGIDRQALNLAATAAGLAGMDFGTTTLTGTNAIELTKGGSVIAVAGQLDVAHFQVKQGNATSPTLDLRSDYAVTVDQTAASARVQKLNLSGTQAGRELLAAGLTSPMAIAWGKTADTAGDAALNLTVTNLNLADWKAFIGDGLGGAVNVTAKLASQKAGQLLAFQINAQVSRLTTGAGTAAVEQGDVLAQAAGSVTGLKQVKLDNYQLAVVRQGKTLASVSGSGALDTATQDADLQVAAQAALDQLLNLPVAQPADGAIHFKGRVTNRQKKAAVTGELALAPTSRAKNVVQLDGSADTANADAITGSLKITADALDVTTYYDLLANTNRPPAPAAAPTAPARPDEEPAAVTLPLKNFTIALNIGHLYLHEVDIANWQATTLVDGGHIVVQPCQLTLNGAPVKATVDLNLGVPGYTYNVAANANAVPLPPLVDSFVPAYKGQIKGTTTADAQIKGAGVTGAGLQKNLTGSAKVLATNLDLAIPAIRSPLLTTIVNTVIGLPDLIRNPTAVLGNLIGGTEKKSGWTDMLMQSPIESLALQTTVGGGLVQLQTAEVRSAAFQANATGQINLMPVLTNSTLNIPVQVALSQPLAKQIGLGGADTNAAYAALPDFLTMTGTVGNAQAKTDKMALLKLAAQTTGGVAGQVGEAIGGTAGNAAKAVGNLIGIKSTATNAVPATNAPGGGLLDLFKKK